MVTSTFTGTGTVESISLSSTTLTLPRENYTIANLISSITRVCSSKNSDGWKVGSLFLIIIRIDASISMALHFKDELCLATRRPAALQRCIAVVHSAIIAVDS